jgi:hypothetical protein
VCLGGVSSEYVNARGICSWLVSCRSVEVVLHRVFASRMALPSTLSRQSFLSAFPFLTPEEFGCACRAFLDRIHVVNDIDRVGWSSTRLVQEVVDAFPFPYHTLRPIIVPIVIDGCVSKLNAGFLLSFSLLSN